MFLNNDQAESVINKLKSEEKEEIEEIMAYPEDSAGALMATMFSPLHKKHYMPSGSSNLYKIIKRQKWCFTFI